MTSTDYEIKAQAKMDARRQVDAMIESHKDFSAKERIRIFNANAVRAESRFERRAADDIIGQTFDAHEAHYARIAAENAQAEYAAYRVGDEVGVWRHGREYIGRVVEIGARGAVKAEIIYGNGVRRVVPV